MSSIAIMSRSAKRRAPQIINNIPNRTRTGRTNTTKQPKPAETKPPTFKIIETKDIPPATRRPISPKYTELLTKIPTGKTAQITNSDTIKVESMRNYIENQHKHQKLMNIKIVQRTTTDRTTTPPTKTKYLYITKQ